MNASDILKRRLRNTGLSHSPFASPAEAVSHLGAVQAQDFAAAKWALALRVKNATNDLIQTAYDDGLILRTHVMRPTWHFVVPEDLRWLLELTAPRVKARLAPYDRHLELDAALLKRSNAAIVKAISSGGNRTRQELKTVLERIDIPTNVQRLAHVIMWAELDGLICSGPMRGKQFTYALLEQRAPKTKAMDRETALARLARRYFRSHGPAQLKDFAWWSGLAAADAARALESVKLDLEQAKVDGKAYWFSSSKRKSPAPKSRSALLLSVYDEYTIAYRDRGLLSETRDVERMISMGSALTAVIILDGKVAGSWKRALNKNPAEITLNPFRKLKDDEQLALRLQAARYGKFLGTPIVVVE